MKRIWYKIFFLLLINNAYNSSVFNQPKDFLISFLKSTNNEKIIDNISDLCLGNIFNYFFFSMQKSFTDNNFNFEKLSKNLENMVLDTLINCPIKEILSIFNSTTYEIFSPLGFKYKSKIYKKIVNLFYLQYKNNTLNSSSLGQIYGKLFNLIKFDYSELYELEVGTDDDNENEDDEIDAIIENINAEGVKLFEGIFIGMKKIDDGKESKCFKDIMKGKRKILNYLAKAIKNMDKGKSFMEGMQNFLLNLVTVEGLTVDCNLLNLGSSIISKVSSMKEMIRLFYKIIKNPKKYTIDPEQFVDNIKNKKMKIAGKSIGKIISRIFDYNIY